MGTEGPSVAAVAVTVPEGVEVSGLEKTTDGPAGISVATVAVTAPEVTEVGELETTTDGPVGLAVAEGFPKSSHRESTVASSVLESKETLLNKSLSKSWVQQES